MEIDLTGRTALVTGSTQGIGYAIAAGLASAGATVAVNGRTAERVQEAVERLRTEVPGAEVREAVADVADADATAALVADLPRVDSSDLASATTGAAVRVDGGYVDAIVP